MKLLKQLETKPKTNHKQYFFYLQTWDAVGWVFKSWTYINFTRLSKHAALLCKTRVQWW